jgi:arylsulfatase A-like enzyme
MPYNHDTRVPLYIRGPGIPAGTASAALVAMNVDLGPTLLELAGAPDAWPSGTARRDGRSLAALLRAPAAPPAGWRDRMLIEFVGWVTPDEWLSPAQFQLTPSADAGLINGASNRWTALLVANATARTLVADWRPPSVDGRAATNWTEAYDLAADPESLVNIAVKGRAPAARIDAMRAEMWDVAYCVGAACP